MPTLPNPRYAIFATARAEDARMDEAYEHAGSVLGKGHSNRLARRSDVAARVTPQRPIASLLCMAKAAEASENAPLKEVILAFLDASHLQGASDELRRRDQLNIIDELGYLAKAAGNIHA